MGCTALHGVRLSSAPSGDRSANPARVPGRSGLPRVPLSVLSAESLATPSGISRAATSVVSCRSSMSGFRSSSSKHTRSQSRETPLVDCLAAWKLLPNVSRWVLQTVEKGYRIQFGAPPQPFKGLFLTCVSPEQALVLEQEVSSLLRK